MIDMRRPRLVPLEAQGDKSLWIFFVLALLNMVDAFNLNIVWPMLPFMVESYNVAADEEDLGAWVGFAGAAISVGQFLSSFFWGLAADRFGRRPVMLIGMLNSTFSVLVFGTARSYTQCVAGRLLSGLLNGNAGVVKTYIGETTNKSQQVKAFSIFALAFGVASCVAPGVGGFLQRPADQFPATFGGTVFETFPFLLPMLVAASLTCTGGVLGFFYIPETASQWRRMEAKRKRAQAEGARGFSGLGWLSGFGGLGGGWGGRGGGASNEEQFWTRAMEAKGEEDLRSIMAEYKGKSGGGEGGTHEVLYEQTVNGGGGVGDLSKLGGKAKTGKGGREKKSSKHAVEARGSGREGEDGEALLASVQGGEGAGSGGGSGGGGPSLDFEASGGLSLDSGRHVSDTRPISRVGGGRGGVREVEMGSLGSNGGSSRGDGGDDDDGSNDTVELGLLHAVTKSTDAGTNESIPLDCGVSRSPTATAAAASHAAARPPRASVNLNMGGGECGWDRHTVTAAACYAALASVAIGYDEIFPVFAQTSRALGGLDLSAQDIGVVLICGGVALVVFQLTVFPVIIAHLGATRALRIFSLMFAAAVMVVPLASLPAVVSHDAARWAVVLTSQCVKIMVLAVLFTTVIMAVNNSCKNKVKGRVNGASTAAAAFGRIVSPIAHGVIFSWSLRLHVALHQFIVFGFVAACSLGVFLLVSMLPASLDSPPAEDDSDDAGADDKVIQTEEGAGESASAGDDKSGVGRPAGF